MQNNHEAVNVIFVEILFSTCESHCHTIGLVAHHASRSVEQNETPNPTFSFHIFFFLLCALLLCRVEFVSPRRSQRSQQTMYSQCYGSNFAWLYACVNKCIVRNAQSQAANNKDERLNMYKSQYECFYWFCWFLGLRMENRKPPMIYFLYANTK